MVSKFEGTKGKGRKEERNDLYTPIKLKPFFLN